VNGSQGSDGTHPAISGYPVKRFIEKCTTSIKKKQICNVSTRMYDFKRNFIFLKEK